MPTIASRTPVLEGRAEVITYARDTSVYYLRQFIKEKKGYRTRKIDGVSNLNDAKDKALEIYIELSQSTAAPSRHRFLEHQQERCDSGTKSRPKGIIKQQTLKNKREALCKHLLGYCEAYGLTNTNCVSCQKKLSKERSDIKKKFKDLKPPEYGTPCDACDKPVYRNWQLDHCHETGEFRGWTCKECNTGMGLLGDTVESLEKRVLYLKNANARNKQNRL